MYQLPKLSKFPLIHGFSTVNEGNMSYKRAKGSLDKVLSNRKKFISSLGIDYSDVVGMYHEHEDRIIPVDPDFKGKEMYPKLDNFRCDGLITDDSSTALFMVVADCLPVIIFDPIVGAVSLVHAGKAGTDLEIVRKGIEKLVKEYNSDVGNIVVAIGPGIHKESYIYEELHEKPDNRWEPYIQPVKEGFSIDIVGFNSALALKSGISEDNLFVSDINTVDDQRFFSHYRDYKEGIDDKGRFGVVVKME